MNGHEKVSKTVEQFEIASITHDRKETLVSECRDLAESIENTQLIYLKSEQLYFILLSVCMQSVAGKPIQIAAFIH